MNAATRLLAFSLAAATGVVAAESLQAPGATATRAAEIAPLAVKSLLLDLGRVGDRLIAVGERGSVLLSKDGVIWDQSPVPVQATLTTVSFADGKNGWAGGHDQGILHSTDGGLTWKLQHRNTTDSKPVLSVLALDAQRALAAGAYGLLLSTMDGGATWSPVAAPEILDDGLHLNGLIRLGNGDLFVVGETGLIGVSSDGATWTRLQQPYEGSLFGALPRGEKGALIFGLRGNALMTDDVRSGTWTALNTKTVQSLFAGVQLPGSDVMLVGADGAMLRVAKNGDTRIAITAGLSGKSEGYGTLSSVMPWKAGLLVVGEQGVTRIPVVP